ncbi:MAG: 7-cyano-7-deazaguanine synthase QueC [Candidatus Neomarinimicrobiota bacterium]
MKKAIILLSGGLDSTTVMAIAISQGYELHALTIIYGQRNVYEIKAAEKVARYFEVKDHIISQINLRAFGGSALTADLAVPKDQDLKTMSAQIPVTYVPARNTIFLSLALAWAETLPAVDIFIGVNALDYSGYPDCRPEFIESFESMANLSTKIATETGQKITIHTPLINLSKADIIRKGIELRVDYGLTHSCYDPSENGAPCGHCDACLLRRNGFKEAQFEDPLHYPD